MIDISKFDLLVLTTILSALGTLVGWLATRMHNQAMTKLDKLIDTVQGVTTQMAVHDEKLTNGNVEFEKIAAHQKEQDFSISRIDMRMARIEQEVINCMEKHNIKGD